MKNKFSRRDLLRKSAVGAGVALLAQIVGSRSASAATWRKLQVGVPVQGLYTWGRNECGQLGDNTLVAKSMPVRVCGIDNALAVSLGGAHMLALMSDGTIKSWGKNVCGQLGNNTITNSSTPVNVCGISTAMAIGSNGNSSYAILRDGTIRGWGENYVGALGDGTTISRSTPVAVCGISTAIATNGTLALLANGTLLGWGPNNFGHLGDGSTSHRCTPVSVCGISTAVAISNDSMQKYAVLADGTIKGWGRNCEGTMGNTTSGNDCSVPVAVCTITNAIAIRSGFAHATALLANGCLMSWGSSGHGRRGDGTNSGAAATPVFVCGISTAVAVGGFTDGSAALLANGTLRTWGNADSGVLGNNDSSNHRCTPVAVCGISNAFSSVTWSKRRPNPMLVLSNGGDFNFAFIHRG